MKIDEVAEPIACRLLKCGQETLFVKIGMPQPFEDGDDFYCPYCIEAAGQTTCSYAAGMDSVQALQLAMKKIGAELRYLAEKRGSPISWVDDTPGDTGFPTS